jgi:hypothetical protein
MTLFMKGKNVFIAILPKELWNGNWVPILLSVNWKSSAETATNGNLLTNPVNLNCKYWVEISKSGNWLVILIPLSCKPWVEIARRVQQKIENQYQARREQSDSIRVTHATPQPVRLRSATRSEYKWAIKIHIDPRHLKRFKIFDTGNCITSQRLKPNFKMAETNTATLHC